MFLCPRLLRAAILPLKHLYGIKMQVWGLEHLNTEELYVIVCNHQAALDLMGMCKGDGGLSTCIGSFWGAAGVDQAHPLRVPERPGPGFVQGSVVGISQKR